MKAVNSAPLVQPKHDIHSSGDHFEKEADRVADRVTGNERTSSPINVSKISSGVQRKCSSCEAEEHVQKKAVQRKCASCEQEEKTVQAKTSEHNHSLHSSDSGPPAVKEHSSHTALDTVLNNQHTRGSPLPGETRSHMEAAMGADFSHVRVHTGPDSHQASASIGARAFTNGPHIHFANGELNTSSQQGKHLLAHELTHTVQQGAAPQKNITQKNSIEGLRKIVPKEKHEKKLAHVHSPHENKDASRKEADEQFSKKFKNKKAPHLHSGDLKKHSGKHPPKAAAVLPKKEEKKKPEKPARPPINPAHLVNTRRQQGELAQLASSGIRFRPDEKKEEDTPVQKSQKEQSARMSSGILSKAADSASLIASSIMQIRPRLSASSARAILQIKNNEAVQKEKIATQIKAEKDAVKKSMQHAIGSINGYHTRVVSGIKAAALKGRMDILLAKTINTVAIELAAAAQKPKIDKAYEDAKKDFKNIGSSIGNECASRQSQRSWTEFVSKMIHEDDSLLDGPYTDDMKQARGDAAVKVGDGYKDGLIKAGDDQSAKIDEGKPADYKKIDDAKTEFLKHLDENYDNSLKGIDAAEKNGISQADSTKKSMSASVYTQHKTAQSQLDTTQKMQIQFTEILSLKQSQQIELQSAQIIEAMEEGGAQSLSHLNSSFKEYKQVCESMNSPPPPLLQQKLQPIEASLAASAPSIAASMQKGISLAEARFVKTATDTITTNNTTVGEALADAKATNTKAIEGLKKLQSSAITALHGTLNNHKKTISSTAAQCVTDIQDMKSRFDGALTSIDGDIKSGLKASGEEFRKALQNTVDHDSGENKSMLNTSLAEEEKAAGECKPRWKSVLKILLIIAVTLVIALVVGPAVIGFIGAAVGGGAFGAVVGAVVGGAILGAASSAVITIGSNIIDGKTWYEGVGHAMLEGAITGAIGGAFGAAGSGIAGKLIGTAAKGIGPALGRFAIQQTIDFGGNVAVEYASAKINHTEFKWAHVAQGQAIGAGMHIGMGGLGALKNVKGFKTANAIMESSAKLGERVGGSFSAGVKAKFGAPIGPKIEPHTSPTKITVEEPVKGSPVKEEVAVAKPADEKIPQTKTEEHVGATPKEEPVAKTKEEATPVAEEKSPAKVTPEEKADGIVAKHPTEDGHNMKVTEGGMLVKCSTCEIVDFNTHPYKEELLITKRKQFEKEWNEIQKESNPEVKAKKAADFDGRLNAEFDKQLSEGANAARKAGLPPAEDGYHWKSNGNGEPIYSNNSKNGGNLRMYDKEKGTFVDTGKRPSPKPDIEAKYKLDSEGRPIKESFDTQAASTKEAKDVKQAHEERARAKEEKDKLTRGSDEYNQKNKEMIDHAEALGEKAADAYMKDKYGVDPEFTGSGSRTVDKVYVGKDGKVYVVEAKGGSSDLGTKVSTEGGTKGKILEQGSREYLQQTIGEMKASGDPKKIAAATKMEAALESGDLIYLHVSQKVGPKGELVPSAVKEFHID
jgi:hypothetical protein